MIIIVEAPQFAEELRMATGRASDVQDLNWRPDLWARRILGQLAEEHVGVVPKGDSALQSKAKMRNCNVLREIKKRPPPPGTAGRCTIFLRLGSGDRAP